LVDVRAVERAPGAGVVLGEAVPVGGAAADLVVAERDDLGGAGGRGLAIYQKAPQSWLSGFVTVHAKALHVFEEILALGVVAVADCLVIAELSFGTCVGVVLEAAALEW
jgi:hypothetical protein